MTSEREPSLIQSLPLHGRRLIEASAGTGKTYTLAGLYLRLVLGIGGEARMPPQILVLTFTRAATRELRDRIRSRLVEAAQVFRSGHCSDENLQWLLEQFAVEQRAGCARLLDLAAGWMDEAAIHTIHAWCQTMLRQHAFDAGSLFDQNVDAPDPRLFQLALADYWREWWYLDHPYRPHLNQIAESFDQFAGFVSKLCRSSATLVAAGREITRISPGEFLNELKEREAGPGRGVARVLNDWSRDGGEVTATVLGALDSGHFYADSKSNTVAATKSRLPALMENIAAWQSDQPFPVDLGYLCPAHLTVVCKKNKAPSHPWLDRLQQALEAMGGYPDRRPGIWAHAVDWVSVRLATEKQRFKQLDFDDLMINLDRALLAPGGEALRETILSQYPIALVDEFQDTDPVQYRIFRNIWGRCSPDDQAHGLFLIGDPKQSIYSFRGADIHAYMDARASTDSRHSLTCNFRSSHGMVAAVNHLFACGERHPRGAFAFASPHQERTMPFEVVAAKGLEESLQIDGRAMVPMTLWYHPEGPGRSNLGVTEYREIMAEQAAEEIVQLLNRAPKGAAVFEHRDGSKTPLHPADIAVLVRKKTQADLVIGALRKRGVATVYLADKDSIFDTAEARELCLVLRAVAEAGDERHMRTALATRLLSRTLPELDELNRDEQHIEREFARFDSLLRLWRRKGVLAMVRRLLEDYDLPVRLLADPRQGERAITNLLHLAELLQAESQTLEGEHALGQWLSDQIELEYRGQNDEQKLRLESDAELVRVVTSHASKGLEYPLVFAPFVCDYSQPGGDHGLTYHDGTRRVIDLVPEDDARHQATLESLQEELRLFYVTITRARHACWLGLAPVRSGGSKNAPGALDAFPFGHLLLGLCPDPASPPSMIALLDKLVETAPEHLRLTTITLPVSRSTVPAETASELGQARSYQGNMRSPWWIASYSALKQVGGKMSLPTPQDAAEEQVLEEADAMLNQPGAQPRPAQASLDLHGFPRGPRPGTFLHGLLEWAGQQGFAQTTANPRVFFDQIERRCRLRGWERWTSVIQQWLVDQLRQPMILGGQSLCLADLDRSSYTPELEFWFQASEVDTTRLDQLVCTHTLGSATRIPLARNTLNGMMRGFIDLAFEHHGRYYVLDYKSNHLGADASAYTVSAMETSVLDKRYDLQFCIYTLALHRLLKSRLPDYDYCRHVGGTIYLYLRGCGAASGGVLYYQPDQALIEALDELFSDQELNHAA